MEWKVAVWCIVFLLHPVFPQRDIRDAEQDMFEFLQGEYETKASEGCNLLNIASWNYNVDVENEEKVEAMVRTTFLL